MTEKEYVVPNYQFKRIGDKFQIYVEEPFVVGVEFEIGECVPPTEFFRLVEKGLWKINKALNEYYVNRERLRNGDVE